MVDESSDKKGSDVDSEEEKNVGKETSEEMPSSAETPEIPIAGAEESRYEERTPDALSLISDLREGGRYR